MVSCCFRLGDICFDQEKIDGLRSAMKQAHLFFVLLYYDCIVLLGNPLVEFEVKLPSLLLLHIDIGARYLLPLLERLLIDAPGARLSLAIVDDP